MSRSYSGEEFLKVIPPESLKEPIVLHGMTKQAEDDPKAMLFSDGTLCRSWIKIPLEMIDKIEHLGTINCRDHDHPFVALYLKEPSGQDAAAGVFADLLRTRARQSVTSAGATKAKETGPVEGQITTGEFTTGADEELRASAYVEDARSGFHGSPAGGTYIGAVLVRAPLAGKYGRQANSTGRPIGGGYTYGDWITPPAEGFVRTFADLQAAMDSHLSAVLAAIAQNAPMPRRIILVAGDAEIEIGAATLTLPPGVTLASSRGLDRSPGGLIKSSSDTPGRSFVVLSRASLGTTRPLPPVRITGLRFQGPNPHEDAPDLWDCSSAGRTAIYAFEDGHRIDPANIVDRVIEIDNNEFGAWPAVAIEIAGVRGGYVHHNFIHHSQRNAHSIRCGIVGQAHALGYGVVINNSLVYIEANRFEMNRHSIASRGDQYTDYIAMYNELGEDGPSHHFDVHGGEDRSDGTHIAARNIVIAYNTDRGNNEDAVNIRGNPTQGAYVTGNQFRVGPSGIRQTKEGTGLGITVWNNQFNFSEKQGGTPGPGWRPGSHNPTQPQ